MRDKIINVNGSADVDLAFRKFIIDSIPVAVVAVDSDFKITQFNRWAEKLTGYSASEAVGRTCADMLKSEMCGEQCPLKAALKKGKSSISSRAIIHDKEGKCVHVQISAAALFDQNGTLLGGVEGLLDISQLVAMERERANFASMLAHDMRSSLTGIHGLGLRLVRKPSGMDEEKEKKYLEIIVKEAAKLESLIDDFLEFSSVETGRFKLNLAATSLDKELEEIYETYKERAVNQGVSIEMKINDFLPIIEADVNRLRRVFVNLLDNAFKFSRKDGTVAITAKEGEREVIVTITDDGIGIEARDLPYIFDTFHRGRTEKRCQGHGLGLATVRAIVEAHGGRVIVASQKGSGATFTVFLPKKQIEERLLTS